MIARRAAASLSVAVLVLAPQASLFGAVANAVAPIRPGNGGAATAATTEMSALPAPVSVREFARRLGLEPAWLEPGKMLRLASPWSRIDFNADSREILLNGVRAFLGEPAVSADDDLNFSPIDRDRFLDAVLAPQRLEPRSPIKRIVLDPGHGGKADGTRNDDLGLLEKHLVLDVAKRLGPILEARGFEVSYTRTDDLDLDLPDRPAFASRVGADLFLSIHLNSARAEVQGIETYVLTRQHQRSTGNGEREPDDSLGLPGNDFDGWNAYLGYTMHTRMLKELGAFDRGLKQARFAVLRDLQCPGLLLECGYLSNPEEARRIQKPEHRQEIATAIAHGVDVFNQTLKRLAAVRAGGR